MVPNTPKLLSVVGNPSPADRALKELLARLISRSRKTRKDIAGEMGALTGMRISKRMIDDWTCPSKAARFPAFLVPVFSQVIGEDTLQRNLAGPWLCELIQLGQRASESQWALEKALAEVRKLAPQPRQTKRRGK